MLRQKLKESMKQTKINNYIFKVKVLFNRYINKNCGKINQSFPSRCAKMGVLLIGSCVLFALSYCDCSKFFDSKERISYTDLFDDSVFDFDYKFTPRGKRNLYRFDLPQRERSSYIFDLSGERRKKIDPYSFDLSGDRTKRERPNNYHPSLPIPSPFVTASQRYARQKRKQDKILRLPLYFSYNKPEDQTEESTNYKTEDSEDYEEEEPSAEDSKIQSEYVSKHNQSDSDQTSESAKVVKVEDSAPAEQKHHHKQPSHHEKGGGKDHKSEHHAESGEEGKKKYEGHHKHEKHEKGHHDKEGHKGKYGDQGGQKKKYNKEDGFYGGHKAGEEGEKGAEVKIFKKFLKYNCIL